MADETLLRRSTVAILNEALKTDYGIAVSVHAPNMTTPSLRAKQVLYRFKNENSDFANLQIRLSPDDPDNELWIINTERLNN